MTLTFPLRSDRLELRPFAMTDVDAAHRVYSDPEVMRCVGEGRPATRAASAQMIADYRLHQELHGFAFWAVIERASGELIGDAGLEKTAEGIELGYTLARDRWGQGLATEAARLCIDTAFEPLELGTLVALADVENPLSAHVLEKLGFALTGSVTAYGRPHHRYALTRRPRPR